jgi:DNA-binding beta-propeller fold protein YncE
VTSGNNTLDFINKLGTGAATYTGGGLNAPAAVAVDGAGYVWIANSGTNTISEFNNAGTAQSGATGMGAASIGSAPSSIAIDNTGGVWVANKSSNSVTHVFGAAKPVVTPLATATTNGTLGTAP